MNVVGEGKVAVVDGFTDRIREKVKVGEGNYVFSLDITNTLYVANQSSNSISVVRPETDAGPTSGGQMPGFLTAQGRVGVVALALMALWKA